MKPFKPKQQTISDEIAAMQSEADDPILPTVKAEARKTKQQTIATWTTIGALAAGVAGYALSGGGGESGKQTAQREDGPTPPVYTGPPKGPEPAPPVQGTIYQPTGPNTTVYSGQPKGVMPAPPVQGTEFQPIPTPAPALPPTPAPVLVLPPHPAPPAPGTY